MEADKTYKQASKIVELKINFYKALLTYVFITGGLVIFNVYSAGSITWSKWVIIGWGIGIALHWFSVFVKKDLFSKNFKEKMIKKEMKKLS